MSRGNFTDPWLDSFDQARAASLHNRIPDSAYKRPWYTYYRVLQCIFRSSAVRVILEDVLNDMLTKAHADLQTDGCDGPTTLELHDFMLHMANSPAVFDPQELAHLMGAESWGHGRRHEFVQGPKQ